MIHYLPNRIRIREVFSDRKAGRACVLIAALLGLPWSLRSQPPKCLAPVEITPARPSVSGYLEPEDCHMSEFVRSWRPGDVRAARYSVTVGPSGAITVEVSAKGQLKPCLTDGASACRPTIMFNRPGTFIFYVTSLSAPGLGRYSLETTLQKAPDPTFTCALFEGTIGCSITGGSPPPEQKVCFEFLTANETPAGCGTGRSVQVSDSRPSALYTLRETLRPGRYTIYLWIGGQRAATAATVIVAVDVNVPHGQPQSPPPFACEMAKDPDRPAIDVVRCWIRASTDFLGAKVGFRPSSRLENSSITVPAGGPVYVDRDSPHAKYIVVDHVLPGMYFIDLFVDDVFKGRVQVAARIF